MKRVPHGSRRLPQDAPEHLVLRRRVLQVCDAVGAFIEYWGFKAIHGRVWTLLALHREPLLQRDIVRMLGASRSSISETVAELVDLGLVRSLGDHRMAPYTAVVDVWPTISDILRSREWMLLEAARTAMEGALSEAVAGGARDHSTHPFDEERLRMLLRMTELFQSLLKMLIAMRVPQSMPGLSRALNRTASLVQSLRRLA